MRRPLAFSSPISGPPSRPSTHPLSISSTTQAETPHLPKKPNYNFEKRRKELEKKTKREMKQAEKRRRKGESATSQPEESALPVPDEGLVARLE